MPSRRLLLGCCDISVSSDASKSFGGSSFAHPLREGSDSTSPATPINANRARKRARISKFTYDHDNPAVLPIFLLPSRGGQTLGQQSQSMEIDTEILTRRLTAKYTKRKGKAGLGHRAIDGSFASYRKGTRISGFRGCGASARRLKGFSMRPAQSLTIERLESRCVLSAVGPDLPRHIAPAAETSVVPLPAIATPPAETVARPAHHEDLAADRTPVLMPGIHPTEYAAQSSGFNSAPSGYWAPEPVVTYVEVITITIYNPAPSHGFNDGFYDLPSRPEYRPPSGLKQVLIEPPEGASVASTTLGADSLQTKVSEHANLSEIQTQQASSQSAALNRLATNAASQTAYPAAPLIVRGTTLTPTPAAMELLEFVLGKRSASANVARLAGDPSQTAIAWATSAVQLVQAGTTGLAGGDLIADFVRGLPRLAEMPLPSVEQAIETVMADIKLIGTEVSQWLEGIHFTPMVLAVTAATAGAGAAAYLRRRSGREAGDRDDEASSSWLFARLQTIPLEA